MTCAEMFERMLEADLSDLRLDAASPLAEHLRNCARCRSIATQIRRDTVLLATVTAGRTPRRRSLVRRYAAVAVAASLCVVVARWPDADEARDPISLRGAVVAAKDTAPTDTGSTRSARPLPAMSPGTSVVARHHDARQLSARRVAAPAGSVVANPVRAQRIPAAVATQPTSVAAIRLQGTPDVPLGATVSADPIDGKRATIIRTTNPAITVVWLQD